MRVRSDVDLRPVLLLGPVEPRPADATRTCVLTGFRVASYVDTLAAAIAQAGDFAEAVRRQEQAMELAPTDQQPDYATRRDRYAAGRPHRDTEGEPVAGA